MTAIVVRVEPGDFDLNSEVERVKGAGAGAVVAFIGICRDEGGRLTALELEHYPGMAEGEIERIAHSASERWPLTAVTIIHRHGKLMPGDNIVLVIAASEHRRAAFEAASYLMDFMKTSAPFWKREHTAAGGPGPWVGAKDSDEKAAGRW